VQRKGFVDHGDLLLREGINWSRCALRTPAVRYILSWLSFPQIWIDSHPITCCFWFLVLPVLCTFFKCVSGLLFWVATIAASRSTDWCLHCCWVSPGGALSEAPVVRLDSAQIAPGGCVSGARNCCSRNVRKMITKRSGKCWTLYSELQVKMEWVTANLQVEFKLKFAAYSCRGFQKSCDFSKFVRSWLYVYRATSRWTTADISCLIDIERSFFEWKYVWWYLSQDIAGVLHESHANYVVLMYC
jgi:hypothetical protein